MMRLMKSGTRKLECQQKELLGLEKRTTGGRQDLWDLAGLAARFITILRIWEKITKKLTESQEMTEIDF